MASPRHHPHTPQPVHAPASSIQSAQAFDREWSAQMQVLLTQLGEVERKGLLMFHKIEESFKHPYAQSEALADTANLLSILDTLIAHAKATGFGALSLQQLSGAASTSGVPGLVSAASTPAGTMTFMSPNSSGMTPRMMQTSLHGNQVTAHATTTTTNPTGSATSAPPVIDTIMTSPAPFPGSMTSTPTGMVMSPPPGLGHTTTTNTNTAATGGGSGATAATTSTSNTPAAGTTTAAAAAATTGGGPATPQAPTPGDSGALGTTNKVTVAQLIEARQTNVQALYAEKAKLKQHLRAAITMVK